jgi:hypothetical protein
MTPARGHVNKGRRDTVNDQPERETAILKDHDQNQNSWYKNT